MIEWDWFNTVVSPNLGLCCKLRILLLIPSFIRLYCRCSLCPIFKVCHGKFNFLSYLVGIRAIEMSPAKNICSSINTSKFSLKSVCHGGKQLKDKIVITVQTYLFKQKIFLQVQRVFLLVHKKQITFWVSDIVRLIGNFKYVYRVNNVKARPQDREQHFLLLARSALVL